MASLRELCEAFKNDGALLSQRAFDLEGGKRDLKDLGDQRISRCLLSGLTGAFFGMFSVRMPFS